MVLVAITLNRPYRDDNNTMYVVWHDDKFINFYIPIIYGYFIPNGLNHFTSVIQHHFPVNDISKQTHPVLDTNGYEICPCPGIIIPL